MCRHDKHHIGRPPRYGGEGGVLTRNFMWAISGADAGRGSCPYGHYVNRWTLPETVGNVSPGYWSAPHDPDRLVN
jgi:hypothetical protein